MREVIEWLAKVACSHSMDAEAWWGTDIHGRTRCPAMVHLIDVILAVVSNV
jgi:hypothetical protein